MTTTRSVALMFVPALVGSALLAATPAAALDNEGRAVAQCRAEMLRQFPADTIRTQRVASIDSNARHTRVAFFVTTDRRYSFECTTGADGQIQSASANPPVSTRLAGAGGGNQAQR